MDITSCSLSATVKSLITINVQHYVGSQV